MVQTENYYKESEQLIYKVKEQIAKLDYDIKEKEFLKSVMEEKYVEVIKDHRTVFDTMRETIEQGVESFYKTDNVSKRKVKLFKEFLENTLFSNKKIKIESIQTCTDMTAFYGYEIKITIPKIDKNIYKIFIPDKTEITKDNLNYAYFGKIAFGVDEPAYTKILFKAYNPEQVAEYIKDNIINKPTTVSNDNPFYQQVRTDSEPV